MALKKKGYVKSKDGYTYLYRISKKKAFGVHYGRFEPVCRWSFESKPEIWQDSTKNEFLTALSKVVM